MAGAQRVRADRTAGAISAMLVFGGLGLLLLSGTAPVGEAVPAAALATVELTDDDAGDALFPASRLSPGRPVSNCLRLVYGGSASGRTVRLLATDAAGVLVSRLQIKVEVGTGGEFGDCTGFSGTEIYDGTLTGLAGTADEPGVTAGWSPAPGDVRTYRLTATLPDDGTLQAASGSTTLTWALVGPAEPDPAAAPSSTPPPSPTTSPPSPPTPAPTDSTDPTDPADPTDPTDPPTDPPAQPSGGPTEPDTTRTPSDGPERVTPTSSNQPPPPEHQDVGGPTDAPGPVAAVRRFATQVMEITGELASRTVRHSGYPLLSLMAMVIFLLAQDRIDRRDPKLALAPVVRSVDLHFDTVPEWTDQLLHNGQDRAKSDDGNHGESVGGERG